MGLTDKNLKSTSELSDVFIECPYCGSQRKDTKVHHDDDDDVHRIRTALCYRCGKTWTDHNVSE